MSCEMSVYSGVNLRRNIFNNMLFLLKIEEL